MLKNLLLPIFVLSSIAYSQNVMVCNSGDTVITINSACHFPTMSREDYLWFQDSFDSKDDIGKTTIQIEKNGVLLDRSSYTCSGITHYDRSFLITSYFGNSLDIEIVHYESKPDYTAGLYLNIDVKVESEKLKYLSYLQPGFDASKLNSGNDCIVK